MTSGSRSPAVRTILIAGGGSGGHIAPGLAIAECLPKAASKLACQAEIRSIFVCSRRPIDAHMLETAGVEFEPIDARPLGARPRRLIAFLRGYRRGRAACRQLIRERSVEQVLALGGFVSAPAVAAARSLDVPVTMLNLDDPPGKANRLIAPRCDRVLSAIPLASPPGFADQVVGLPIRRSAIADGSAEDCRQRLGLEPDRETLLVTGASQGATSINQLILALAQRSPGLFANWQILHLAGLGAGAEAEATYANAGVCALVLEFCDGMGDAWGAASLAISRAGANSVAEASANAVPTVFLPYPYHRDMHQFRNAQPLADLGGALIEPDQVDVARNIEHAGARLRTLIADPDRRDSMRAALKRNRPPDAAMRMAELLLERVRSGMG